MGAPMGASDEKNSLGVWALVLGILSIVCCGLVAGIPAIILGNNSKKAAAEGRATNGTLGNVGFILGIVGTVLGTLGIIFAVVNGTFAAISGS
jgi:putative exporter of polyketide antibiotics